jgi:hypothetical protein
MPSIVDIPIPCEPSDGIPDNWKFADPEHRKQFCRDLEQVEEALGDKGIDPKRRERLCRHLLTISDLYFGPFARTPQVRAGNVDRALTTLRGHAAALQACLWWGAPRKAESFADLLKPLDEPPPPPDDGLSELDRWAMFYVGTEILPIEKQRALLDGRGRTFRAALGGDPRH